MYFNPFWVGVIAAVFAGLAIFFIAAVIAAIKQEKQDNNK